MGSNDSLDHEMERTLRDYFGAESGPSSGPRGYVGAVGAPSGAASVRVVWWRDGGDVEGIDGSGGDCGGVGRGRPSYSSSWPGGMWRARMRLQWLPFSLPRRLRHKDQRGHRQRRRHQRLLYPP